MSCEADDFYEPGEPFIATRTDPIVHGSRWRKALEEIATMDPVDAILDPDWAIRIAREALGHA
jgi:hypothetical protein